MHGRPSSPPAFGVHGRSAGTRIALAGRLTAPRLPLFLRSRHEAPCRPCRRPRPRRRAAGVRADQVGPADRLPREQLPHREPAAVRRPTSTRPPAASSRSRCIRTRRCSRRPRSSAPCRAGRRRPARSCWSTSRTRTRCSALDGIPFLATSYAESLKLYKASQQGARGQAREAGHDAALHGAVAAAGHLLEEARSTPSPT